MCIRDRGTAAVQRLSDDAQLTVGGAALAGVSYTYYPAQAWGCYSLEVFVNGEVRESMRVGKRRRWRDGDRSPSAANTVEWRMAA